MIKEIAVVGCGPGGLFMLKSLLERIDSNYSVTLFESHFELGNGMPYSSRGASNEHVTNVSGNEIPEIRQALTDWISDNSTELDKKFDHISQTITDYKVVPRLLFGDYLASQFQVLLREAERRGITVSVNPGVKVIDISIVPVTMRVIVVTGNDIQYEFDEVIICTGHTWPLTNEGKTPGFFDSPYPPLKLAKTFNHNIAITGSSLTAIDAIRTLSRANGHFTKTSPNRLEFIANADAESFAITLYSRHGLLPGVRFHLRDPHLAKRNILTRKQLIEHRDENNGFVSLDYIFEKDFKEVLRSKDPVFYEGIRQMNLESFVNTMMEMRERSDPFQFFKAEYMEAAESIEKRESVYWKEALAILSFAMNYPAKYFSAEDSLRLQKVLMPLISIVIAFVPQHSCEELIALHEAGRLKIIACGDQTSVEPVAEGGVIFTFEDHQHQCISTKHETFINCIGQKHLDPEDFPFQSLVKNGSVTRAKLIFKDQRRGREEQSRKPDDVVVYNGDYHLKVSGISINDFFQPVNREGNAIDGISIMAVPFIGGFNPDYSGLDFCEEASRVIAERIGN